MNSRAYLLNWLAAVVAIFTVIGGAIYVEESFLEQVRQNRALETRARLSEIGVRIESVIESNIVSMQGLAAYLSLDENISQKDFVATAHLFLSNNPLIDTVYRISGEHQYTHYYPESLSLDALNRSAQNSPVGADTQIFRMASKAVAAGEVFISAPLAMAEDLDKVYIGLPLQQGSQLEPQPSQQQAALLLFPMSLRLLYESSGLLRLDSEIDIAVREIRNDRPGSVFFGEASLFSVSDMTYTLSLPGAEWQIVALKNRDTFVERSSRAWIKLAAGFLIGVIFLVLWLRIKELRSLGLIEKQQVMLDQAQRVGRIGNWSWHVVKGDIFWSDEAYRLFGLAKGDPALGKDYLDLIYADDRPSVKDALDDAMARGGRYQADFRVVRSAFDQRWIHSEGFVELNTDRKPVRVFGTFQDVTASRKIERELKQREAQLSAITDAAQSLIMITRVADGVVKFCNPSSLRLLGIPPEELIGRSIIELYPNPDDRKHLLEQVDRDQFLSNYKLKLCRVDTDEPVVFLIGLQRVQFQGDDCFVVDMVDISTMLDAQAALADSEEKFRLFAENVPGIFWLSDPDGHPVEFLSHGYDRITGRSSEDVLTGRSSLFSAVVPEDLALIEEHIFEVSKQPVKLEFRIQRPDGEIRWLRNLSFVTYDKLGRVKNIAGFGEDITDAYLSHQRLKLAASVFENTAEAIVVTNTRNRIVSVNDAFSRITGYKSEEVIGETPALLSSGKQSAEFYAQMWSGLNEKGRWQGEVWNRKKNGELYVEWLSITALRNRFNELENYVAVFSDITDRKEKEELIRYQANYDALTALPNRVLFNDRLTQAINSCNRYSKDRGALMFIDLDHFKEVNDTLGHEAGDHLLKEVAQRLKKYTREADTVARLGGDEFTVMIPAIHSIEHVGKVAEKIIEALSKTFLLHGNAAHISASIGVTIFPDDGDELTRILQNADQAMYAAKSAGRRTYRFFTPEMQHEAERRQSLQNDLRIALIRHEFEVHYQPIVDHQGKAVKVEALVRWNHPEQGRISPDQFIPLAEETGLIITLGGWVFEQAVRDIAKIHKQYPDLGVAINLSSKQIGTDSPHTEHFIDILQQYDLPSSHVTLEVTESLFLDPSGDSVTKLKNLRHQGFGVAIDDFGTGYSSLSYLKQLPLTTIKIDKSFVSDLDKDFGDRILVDAILSIAESMQLSVIAEGVETQAQADYLIGKGAQMQQGWLYGRPMPFDALNDWLKENK